MITNNPILTPEKRGEDLDAALRPQTLDDFTGQAEARANLKIFIEERSISNIDLHVGVGRTVTHNCVSTDTKTISDCGSARAVQIFVCLPVKNNSMPFVSKKLGFSGRSVPIDVRCW